MYLPKFQLSTPPIHLHSVINLSFPEILGNLKQVSETTTRKYFESYLCTSRISGTPNGYLNTYLNSSFLKIQISKSKNAYVYILIQTQCFSILSPCIRDHLLIGDHNTTAEDGCIYNNRHHCTYPIPSY